MSLRTTAAQQGYIGKITMDDNGNRHLQRDSLFVMADLRFEETGPLHRIKIRNLSAGGLMAEGDIKVTRGVSLEVYIRNIGWVEGSVAWVEGQRLGIAFSVDIDPMLARGPAECPDLPENPFARLYRPTATQDELKASLRKV